MMKLGFLRQQVALLIDKYGEETAVLMMGDDDKIRDIIGWAESRTRRNDTGGWQGVVCFLPGREVKKAD